jgi:hypothetical protein
MSSNERTKERSSVSFSLLMAHNLIHFQMNEKERKHCWHYQKEKNNVCASVSLFHSFIRK